MTLLVNETFTGTTGTPTGWTASAGAFTYSSNQGALAPPATAYGAGIAFNTGFAGRTGDFDFLFSVVPITGNVEQYPGGGMGAAGSLCSFTGIPADGYGIEFHPETGTANWYFARGTSGTATSLSGNIAKTYTSGASISAHIRRRGNVFSVWVWDTSGTKPSTPQWTGTDASPNNSTLKPLLAHAEPTTAQRPVLFDNVILTDGNAGGTDPIGITDSATFTIPITGPTVTDPVGITDSATFTIPAPLTLAATDAVGITDSATFTIPAPLTLAQNDPVGITDSLTLASIYTRTQTDAVGITDSGTFTKTNRPWHQLWFAALSAAKAGTGTAAMYVEGDSLTEGQGASVKTNRWIDKALTSIRAKWQPSSVTGGVGYLPGWYNVYTSDFTAWNPYSARSGSISNLSTDDSLGERTAQMSSGSSQTYTVTGTAADIYWVGGGGTFTWAVDGGSTTAVSTSAGGVAHRTRISLGSAGSHSLVIAVTSGTVLLGGIFVFNGDTTAGVQLYEGAHTGYMSTDHGSGMLPVLDLVAPDLVVIMIGGNDLMNGGRTGAQVKTTVVARIAAIRAGLTKEAAIIVATEDQPATFDATAWGLFQTAIKSIATDDPSVGVLDFGTIMGVSPTTHPTWWDSDNLHPNDLGHTAEAAYAAGILGGILATDSVGVTDSFAITLPTVYPVTATDPVGITDSFTLLRPASYTSTATDPVGITDSFTLTRPLTYVAGASFIRRTGGWLRKGFAPIVVVDPVDPDPVDPVDPTDPENPDGNVRLGFGSTPFGQAPFGD